MTEADAIGDFKKFHIRVSPAKDYEWVDPQETRTNRAVKKIGSTDAVPSVPFEEVKKDRKKYNIALQPEH